MIHLVLYIPSCYCYAVHIAVARGRVCGETVSQIDHDQRGTCAVVEHSEMVGVADDVGIAVVLVA